MSAQVAAPPTTHPLKQKAPTALTVAFSEGDPVPARNYKVIKNMAGIEIAELKDALAYTEYQLSKTHAEKETFQKEQATSIF
jgi:hypothetical protein